LLGATPADRQSRFRGVSGIEPQWFYEVTVMGSVMDR
jgi:hypothetical protein